MRLIRRAGTTFQHKYSSPADTLTNRINVIRTFGLGKKERNRRREKNKSGGGGGGGGGRRIPSATDSEKLTRELIPSVTTITITAKNNRNISGKELRRRRRGRGRRVEEESAAVFEEL